jgi:hypothetical protein
MAHSSPEPADNDEGDLPRINDTEWEAVMRRVVESTLISADGVIGEPHRWTGEHFGEEAVPAPWSS